MDASPRGALSFLCGRVYTFAQKGRLMKIEIETDRSLAEPEVLLRCAAVDESIAAIVASLRMHDRRLNGTVPVSYTHLRAHETTE